ncbi:hypothetical protein HDU67_008051 [Dinochytrium kinnereticum]|nr:hypothetical protein HDU67_008051 [Dinochytrium kinnereticum]
MSSGVTLKFDQHVLDTRWLNNGECRQKSSPAVRESETGSGAGAAEEKESLHQLKEWEAVTPSIWTPFPRLMESLYQSTFLRPFMVMRTSVLNVLKDDPDRSRPYRAIVGAATTITILFAIISLFRFARTVLNLFMPFSAIIYFLLSYYPIAIKSSDGRGTVPLGLTSVILIVYVSSGFPVIPAIILTTIMILMHKVDSLLSLNLPNSVISRLRDSGGDFDSITEEFENASVVFCEFPTLGDIGTGLKKDMDTTLLIEDVKVLNTVLKDVEEIVDGVVGAEMIKSIGNKVLILCKEINDISNSHVLLAVGVCLRIMKELGGRIYQKRAPMTVKAGIHSGPLSSAIIGDQGFAYDIYGDTVNTASRMNLYAQPGAIIVSNDVANLLSQEDKLSADAKGGEISGNEIRSNLSHRGIHRLSAYRGRRTSKGSRSSWQADARFKHRGTLRDVMRGIVTAKDQVAATDSPATDIEKARDISQKFEEGRALSDLMRLQSRLENTSATMSRIEQTIEDVEERCAVIRWYKKYRRKVEKRNAGLGVQGLNLAVEELLANEEKKLKIDSRKESMCSLQCQQRSGHMHQSSTLAKFIRPVTQRYFNSDLEGYYQILQEKSKSSELLFELIYYKLIGLTVWAVAEFSLALRLTVTASVNLRGVRILLVVLSILMTALVAVYYFSYKRLRQRSDINRQEQKKRRGFAAFLRSFGAVVFFFILCFHISYVEAAFLLNDYRYRSAFNIIQTFMFNATSGAPFYIIIVIGSYLPWIFAPVAEFITKTKAGDLDITLGACTLISLIILIQLLYQWERWNRESFLVMWASNQSAALCRNELAKSEIVLKCIMPKNVIALLSLNSASGLVQISQKACILALDITGFTAMASRLEAEEVVYLLNGLFNKFDKECVKWKVEKICTIGDAYIAVGGLLDPIRSPSKNVCHLALQIQQIVKDLNPQDLLSEVSERIPSGIEVRVGVYTGPVCAAIIGGRGKVRYDLIGDALDVATRLEQACQPGKTHVCRVTANEVGHHAVLVPSDSDDVKGIAFYLESIIDLDGPDA